ncbi:hypothetical protein [Streptomyces roseolilacinus]|uniref:hypothetical protein n=1 Tax=Streptomyces roseolilacinus TaxID=66904 RepID=UPI00382F9B46
MNPKDLVDALLRVQGECVLLGRLHALRLLAEQSLEDRLVIAASAVAYFDGASEVGGFLSRYAGTPAPLIAWREEDHPEKVGLLSAGEVDKPLLEQRIERGQRGALVTLAEVGRATRGVEVLAPWHDFARRTSALFGPAEVCEARSEQLPEAARPASRTPTKVLQGPQSTPLDPVFRCTYSILDSDPPKHGDTLQDTVPHMWVLASREALAAELAALCLIEWDNLPLPFYLDFAKQMWDEARHAVFYLNAAVSLLPDLAAELPPGHPLLDDIRAFREEGTGLPIPREGNLYEAMLNATLTERLVIMHHDTETPGVAALEEQINSTLWVRRPQIAAGIAIVQMDERTHARLGHRWLKHLLPDRHELEEAIQNARLMRTMLLLTSCAHHGQQPYAALVSQVLAKKSRFQRVPRDTGAKVPY